MAGPGYIEHIEIGRADLEDHPEGIHHEHPRFRSDSVDFIREIINSDLAGGRYDRVHTRFPPEPNGYLHIGHAKSICLNFGIARDYGGLCNLRFDDTNPCKEDVEYVDSIMEDVRWLGFDWEDRLYYASDYFEQLYDWAEKMILAGQAYVCDLTADEVRQHRGTLDRAGPQQPLPRPLGRGEPRPVPADAGRRVPRRLAHAPGEDRHGLAQPQHARPGHVPHPARHAPPHRRRVVHLSRPTTTPTASPTRWSGITHSICTLEFENHRPLYDWYVEALGIYHPRQIEFARLNLTYTVMSKRRLLELVKEGHRQRLGRSADADDLRPAPPRLHARGHPQLLRADRRGQGRQRDRHRPAGALPARGPEQAGRRG